MSNAALERRLGPVYDAIDSRNYKAALKHADAALKKHPGSQLLLALRAFALQRTGREAEALAALAAIVEQGPESERVLHTMSFTYRAAGRADAVAPAFAVAHERRPHDLDIMTGLFGAYAKELNFVKQQQVALKLAKAQPEGADRYGWWAVASLALQARAAAAGEGGAASSVAAQMARLAETMAARQILRHGGVPTYEALLIYTDLLIGQDKAGEAAEAVRAASEAGSAAGGLAADSRQLLAAALARGGELPAAAALYRQACLNDPNDWWSWRLYLNCVLPGSAGGPGEPRIPGAAFPVGVVGGLADAWDGVNLDGVWARAAQAQAGAVEAATQEARAALAALQAAAAGSDGGDEAGNKMRPSRGAVLAPLELACRLQRLGRAGPRALAEAVAAALPAVCHTFSCAVDLRRYVSQLQSAEDAAWLAQRAAEICEEAAAAADVAGAGADEAASSKAAVKALWCRVNAHALRAELGAAPPGGSGDGEVGPAAAAYAVELVSLYSSNLQLSEGLDPKERGHGEEAVALAAGALAAAARGAAPRRAAALLAAAALALDAAQVRRTVAAPLRLAAAAVYGLLGAPAAAAAQLTALDVKAVLHETMTGHWALPALLAGAATEAELSKPWIHGIAALHVDQVLEASESIFTAYDEGAYSKIPEFVDFWEALGRSHTRWAGEAERGAAALRAAAAQGPAALREAAAAAASAAPDPVPAAPVAPAPEALRFNEDLSTRPAWFPPQATDLRLAVAAWWGGAPAAPAAPGVWWGVPAAGERDCPEAAAWREAQRGGLARRRALPTALAGLLAPEPLDAATVEALRGAVNAAWAAERWCPDAGSDPGLVCAATGALFQAGLAVQAALAALKSGSEAAAAVDAACAALRAAGDRLGAACARVNALWGGEGAQNGLPLPGNAAPALAVALLTEEGAWAGACLPHWAKLLRSAGVPDSEPGKAKLEEAIGAAAAATAAGIAALDAAAVAAHDVPPAAAAEAVLAELKAMQGDIEGLWAYEKDFDAAKALQELASAQAATAARLHVAAAKALSLLAPLAPK